MAFDDNKNDIEMLKMYALGLLWRMQVTRLNYMLTMFAVLAKMMVLLNCLRRILFKFVNSFNIVFIFCNENNFPFFSRVYLKCRFWA